MFYILELRIMIYSYSWELFKQNITPKLKDTWKNLHGNEPKMPT